MGDAASAGVREFLKLAPKSPGCYMFISAAGEVLYAGKSKNVRRRVASYFTPAAMADRKRASLISDSARMEFIETKSEIEALLLEFRLIRVHRPRYNSQLNGSLTHPWLRIDAGSPLPSLTAADSPAPDSARYFGCFFDEYDITNALGVLMDGFGLPVCRKPAFPARDGRVCLHGHLGQCLGPCAPGCDRDAYCAAVEAAVGFLDGNNRIIASLEERMEEEARREDFEAAGQTRDLIESLVSLQARAGRVVEVSRIRLGVVFVRAHNSGEFCAFGVRDGKIVARSDSTSMEGWDGAGFLRLLHDGLIPVEGAEWLAAALRSVFAVKTLVDLDSCGTAGQAAVHAVVAGLTSHLEAHSQKDEADFSDSLRTE